MTSPTTPRNLRPHRTLIFHLPDGSVVLGCVLALDHSLLLPRCVHSVFMALDMVICGATATPTLCTADSPPSVVPGAYGLYQNGTVRSFIPTTAALNSDYSDNFNLVGGATAQPSTIPPRRVRREQRRQGLFQCPGSLGFRTTASVEWYVCRRCPDLTAVLRG